MKPLFYLLVLLVSVSACRKHRNCVPDRIAEMQYTDLKDSVISFGRIAALDLNEDGQQDLLFSTMLVGDPVMQVDKKIWFVSSSFDCNLAISQQEEVPVMNNGALIPLQGFGGYNWFNGNSAVLARKIIPMIGPGTWEGAFKNASRKFLPFQVMKSGGKYNGWVEVSFSEAGSYLKLHKAGISKSANAEIKAGQ